MAEASCLCLGQLRHVEVWLLSVQKGTVVCGDGCEDKGSELHCVSEHCQSCPFYSLLLLSHFPPGEVCYSMESTLQERRWYLSKGCQTLLFTWGEKGNDKVLTPYIEIGVVS